MNVTATDTLSDGELVRACRRGEEAAWAALVERFARYIHAIAVRVYRLSAADAEDVFQETFARAYENLDRLRDDDAIRAWLAQLARRLSIDRLRGAGREVPSESTPEGSALDAELERLDEALVVRAALATLPDNCQEILDRFFGQDQSYETIASELELPEGTIASRISRCLVKLRRELEGR